MISRADEQIVIDDTMAKSAGWVKVLSVVSLVVVTAIYVLRLDRVIGMMGDDSWYVLLAKALATGQGYTLVNSPTPGITPLYPPGFPFLLSLFYRMSPNFPDNLWLLKSVSIVAMIIVGIVSYRYFLRARSLAAPMALGIAVATTLCPPLIFLASSTVMSDCVYMLFFVLTVAVTEKFVAAKNTSREWKYALLTAVLASYTFLVRSIAIALIAAVFIYLLKERLVRSAIIFALFAALFSGPWMIYSRIHAPTPEQVMEHGTNMVLPYTAQFWQRLAGDSSQGDVTVKELPKRFLDNILQITGRDVSRILVDVIFERVRNPYQEATKILQGETIRYGDSWWFSFILSALVIFGFICTALEKLTFAEIAIPMMLVIIIIWPFESFRYFLPLAPFVIYYFLNGVRNLQKLVTRGGPQIRWGLAYAIIIAIIALNLYANANRVVALHTSSSLEAPIWIQKFEGAEKLLKRLEQETKKTDVIVSNNPALITLYTGRKTVGWDDPKLRWETWKKIPVRYMVWIMVYPMPIHAEEGNFRTVYTAPDDSHYRIVDFGDPATRPEWKIPTTN